MRSSVAALRGGKRNCLGWEGFGAIPFHPRQFPSLPWRAATQAIHQGCSNVFFGGPDKDFFYF